jgi:formylglycine-generating enzyme required for sulfatase activity
MARADELVEIPAGRFVMGDAQGEPDERPREATVRAFRLMRFEVTNAEFGQFVAATGHVTDPERSGEGYVWSDRWRARSSIELASPCGCRQSAPRTARQRSDQT